MKNSLKKLLLGGAAVLALGIASQDVMAQATDSDSLATTAVIVTPITLRATGAGTATLDFGTLIADAALAGTATIASDGATAPAYSNVTELTAGTAGQVQVSAEAGRAFDWTATANDLTGPGANMTVTNVTVANNAVPFNGDTTAASGTEEARLIGATLNTNAGQLGGTYNGTIDLTVTYQ